MTVLIIIGVWVAWFWLSLFFEKFLSDQVSAFWGYDLLPVLPETWYEATELNIVGAWIFAILIPIITLPFFLFKMFYNLCTIGRE